MSQKDSEISKIQEIIKIMKANDLVEVEIIHGEDKILLKRAQPAAQTITAMPMFAGAPHMAGPMGMMPAAGAAGAVSAKDEGLVDIKSPIVGTFYSSPSPDSESYVEVGSAVSSNTVICIVEAMKVMNEIKAETSGIIAQVCVKNGQAVEYGQVLYKVRPE